MTTFKPNERDVVRVPKLNQLVVRVDAIEADGGDTTLEIDGGDASNSGTPYIAIDGGSA